MLPKTTVVCAIVFCSIGPASAENALIDGSNITSNPHRPPHDINAFTRHTPGLVARFGGDEPISDTDWLTYTSKGGALSCALLGTDKAAGQLLRNGRNPPSAASTWRGDLKQELLTWHWKYIDPSTYSCSFNDHFQIPFALKSLALNGKSSLEGGDNVCYRIEHWDRTRKENGKQVPAINQWYKVEDKLWHATGAYYEFGVNTKGGAIFGLFLDSPINAASSLWYAHRRRAQAADLPALRAFSDILWGFWVRGNPDVTKIRYFFMLGIVNEVTNQIIARCLVRAKAELREWPGVNFSTATDEGRALLGSPNGAAFAYFLVQRKAELGLKTISKVTVFRSENDDDAEWVDAALVFHVEDAPEPEDEKVEVVEEGRGLVRVHRL